MLSCKVRWLSGLRQSTANAPTRESGSESSNLSLTANFNTQVTVLGYEPSKRSWS